MSLLPVEGNYEHTSDLSCVVPLSCVYRLLMRSVCDNVHVYLEDCIVKRGTDPVTKKQVLTHCCAATGSIVGVSEFFSASFHIFRRLPAACVRFLRASVSSLYIYFAFFVLYSGL